MAQTLHDVLSPTMVKRLLDEDYADNGNWIPAVNGVIIPACTAVEDNPVAPVQSFIRTDARKSPDAELRHYNTEQYMLNLNVASLQANVLNEVLGMGATIQDRAATNTARTCGDVTGLATVDDALFGAFLVAGTVGNQSIAIPELLLPHTDFVADGTGADGSGQGSAYNISSYDYAADAFTVQGSNAIWSDPFLGTLTMTGMTLTTDMLFTWDPSESGIVTIAGESVNIDFKDPQLDRGDSACIFSFAYEYGQLGGNSDWSVTQPLDTPTRVAIDLFRSLGDTVEGPIWERRRYYHTEQRAIPAASTDGSDENPNIRQYSFNCRFNETRLANNSRFYDTDYLVETQST